MPQWPQPVAPKAPRAPTRGQIGKARGAAAAGAFRKAAGVRAASLVAFQRSVKKLGWDVTRRLVLAGKQIMAGIERAAKRRAPVDTGQLRASITWTITSRGGKVVGLIGSAVRHAQYVEFRERGGGSGGATRYAPGGGDVANPITSWPALRKRAGSGQSMPFLRPAVIEVVKARAIDRVKQAIRQASGRGG